MPANLDALRKSLPSGRQLSDSVWQMRHRVVVVAWLLLLPLLLTVGWVNHLGLAHVPTDVVPSFGPSACALFAFKSRRIRACAVSLGLMAASATFVHFTHGLIEAHFLFFVLLPIVALYQDWVPFVLSIGFVLVHHAIIGVASPDQVYNHPSAIAHPVLWALIHASFVAALVVILIFYWYWSAREQRDLAVALDDLRRTQAELVQAQKLESIGQLAAGVAHEINTPIQFVGDNMRFLSDGFGELFELIEQQSHLIASSNTRAEAVESPSADIGYLSTEVPEAIAQSLDGIERVAEIVRALKGVAHPNSDAFVFTDINKLIADTVLVSRSEWKYVAELETDLERELESIECIPGPVNQVLLNMIVNAVHAIEDRFGTQDSVPGRIVIVSRRTERGVELRISDNGGGIPTAIRSKVFDPFFTTKQVGRGTGQGLAICRAVVVGQHHGSIEIESRPGEGSTFIIELPARQPSPVPA